MTTMFVMACEYCWDNPCTCTAEEKERDRKLEVDAKKAGMSVYDFKAHYIGRDEKSCADCVHSAKCSLAVFGFDLTATQCQFCPSRFKKKEAT
jgi:hypothetical protein